MAIRVIPAGFVINATDGRTRPSVSVYMNPLTTSMVISGYFGKCSTADNLLRSSQIVRTDVPTRSSVPRSGAVAHLDWRKLKSAAFTRCSVTCTRGRNTSRSVVAASAMGGRATPRLFARFGQTVCHICRFLVEETMFLLFSHRG